MYRRDLVPTVVLYCIVLYSFPIQDLPSSLMMATYVQPKHAAAVTCVTDGVYRLQSFTYKYCHSSQRSLAVKLYRVPATELTVPAFFI